MIAISTSLLREYIVRFSLCLFLAGGVLFASGTRAGFATGAQATGQTVTETAKLFDSTIRRVGQFGRAVAVAGETLAVGAIYDDTGPEYTDGAVSLYERAGASWALQQKLYSINGEPNDNFGCALALSGDTLAVGARSGNVNGGTQTRPDPNEGFVVIYTRSGGRWVQQQRLSADDVQDEDYFGHYVALHGDTLVVGNWSRTLGRGATYVFTREGTTWTQRQKLSVNGPLGLFGDTLALQTPVGLELYAVQIYARAGGSWRRQQELRGDPSPTPYTTSFGHALALTENQLFVGAPSEPAGQDDSGEGKVYVYERSGAGWVRRQKLALSDATPHDHFGTALAVFGNTLVVGALYARENTRPEAGAAHVFTRNGASWTQQQKLVPSDGLRADTFGISVALSERAVLVGAPQHGRGAPPYLPGGAYAYAIASGARPVVNVSAASYTNGALAPESIVTAFGAGLATATQSAAGTPSNVLAGTTVKLKDSAGTERTAPLFFVSPSQINYQMPPNTARGAATITVTSGDGAVSTADLLIEPVAPGLFTLDASGRGLTAAVVLRVKADGSQQYEPIARFDAAQNKLVALPIDLSNTSERVFLLLFGTGLRHHSGLNSVSVAVGGVAAEVSFAGAQRQLVGLDQVNLHLPRSLAGRGEVDVTLLVNGQAANVVKVSIK
jgi:uncharacterized protein (TIGR03437 family)